MPTFYPDFDSIDIEIDEFLDECSSSEIEEIIDYLEDNNLTQKIHRINTINSMSASESIYESEINKLHNNWNRLTKEEEELILNITKRF